jgi:signal transduction histidine kinase/ligand-binding sensor domain-containing protein
MLVRLVFVLCVSVVASAHVVRAADNDGLLSGYSLTSWHNDAGRPLGSVYAMVQDRDGYLWIGTDSGLLRFDGARFTPLEHLIDTPVPGAAVRSLVLARDGSLWAGLGDRSTVVRLREGTVDRRTRGLEHLEAVTDLVEDGRGVMWAIADRGLFALHADRWQRVRLPWKSREGPVQALYVDRRGTLWVGTRWGVFEHLPSTNGFRWVADGHVWHLGEDRTGRMWTTDVVAGYRQLGAPAAARPSPEGAGSRLLRDHQDDLWIGTFGHGLWHVTGNGEDRKIERATLRSGLSSNSVQSMLVDRDGNIWVGTTAGLHRLSRRTLTPVEDVGFVLTVQPWSDGHVLAGTTNGLVRLQARNGRWRQTRLGIAALDVRSLYSDADGVLWVGATDGLWRFAHDRLTHVNLPSHPNMLVLSITRDRRGALWLGDGEWLYRWDGAALEPVALPPSAADVTRLTAVRGDRSGRLWMGFDGKAVGYMDVDGSFRILGAREGFEPWPNQVLHAAYEDSAGVVWLGTNHGLYRFAQGRMTSIGRAHGLPGDRVWAIAEDVHHQLWLSLDRGLVRVAKESIAETIESPSRSLRYRLYDPVDGLAGAAVGIVSAVSAPDGTLWFVRGGGVTRVDPGDLRESPQAPAPIRIEEAIANDRRLNPTGHTSLPAGTKRLQVSYTAVAVGSSERIRFRYKLEGFDTDWIDAGTRRTAFYTNLQPREYRFLVEGQSEHGIWGTGAAAWPFTIEPSIYQTRAFFIFSAAVVVAAAWLLWTLRLRLIRQRFALVLAERARLSREIHDTLLQSLVGVALQFDSIAEQLDPASAPAQQQLTRVRRQIEAYIRDARQSIWDLRSPVLETQDLVTALREFARNAIGNSAVCFTSSVFGSDDGILPQVENQLLRIGQEAITNAVRHAQPTHLHLDVTFNGSAITLRITDDGCGFDEASWPSEHANHYGLVTMRERAEQMGGTLIIATALGRGTSVEVQVPMPDSVMQEAIATS